MEPLRIASGVLRSCAARARALVVVRKRSRNCSSSLAPSSAELDAATRAVSPDGKPFFGLLPLGATIGIFSDIEGMGNQITSINSIEGGESTTVRTRG